MRHGSLFTGIGGFDLAAQWMGWQNVFHCENNPFCQQVLKKRFPKSIGYDDIKNTDFSIWRGIIDILTGGFPCQPYSVAGEQKGTEDSRHLWPEMLRAAKQIQPRWIVGENVPGIINWSKGMVFEQIQADLEAAGFEVFPPVILPACGLDAPHRRERVWFIAHRNGDGCLGDHKLEGLNSKEFRERLEERYVLNPLHGDGDVADSGRLTGDRGTVDESRSSERYRDDGGREEETDISQRRGTSDTTSDAIGERLKGERKQPIRGAKGKFIRSLPTGDAPNADSINGGGRTRGSNGKKIGNGSKKIIADPYGSERPEGRLSSSGPEEAERHTGLLDARGYEYGTWDNFPTQSPLCGGDDGISNRVDRLKSLGNAIVPEVAYQIFQIIQYMDKLLHS